MAAMNHLHLNSPRSEERDGVKYVLKVWKWAYERKSEECEK